MMFQYLQSYFGFKSFRPLQEEIITHILQKKDCLVLMPTGGGKSICFQIPALMMEGTAIVVSPLISLMKDQVEALRANGIAAAALNSNYTEEENRQTRELALQGRLKLLYISPEKLLQEKDYLMKQIKVSLMAVDEAHCISQWGHDFRPEYTQLGQLRDEFPDMPIAAFTATADKVTKNDIIEQMRLTKDETGEAKVFISSFDRPNLSLDVRRGYTGEDKFRTILSLIKRHPTESGIIYCLSRKNTEMVAEKLQKKGISAQAYHAGMGATDRNRVQEDFINDRIQVVCATIAFGMGIDKSNVRFVVHYNMPKSIENYYQEIGRGGRDGLPCETILFYNVSDLITLRNFAEESGQREINFEKLERMQEYAESQVCRRRILLNYFGETMDHDCSNCDVCKNPPRRFDGTIHVQKALSAICRTKESVGFRMTIDILRGMKTMDVVDRQYYLLKTFGVGHDISARDWQDYMLQMLHLGYIEIDYKDDSHLKVTQQGQDVLYGRKKADLVVIENNDFIVKSPRTPYTSSTKKEASEDVALYMKLVILRKTLAGRVRLAPHALFSDNILHELATARPKSPQAFSRIEGVSDAKRETYAKYFIAVIRDHLNPQNTIKHNSKEFTIELNLYECFLFWRDALRAIYQTYVWNFYDTKQLQLSHLIPEDTLNRDAVVEKFREIVAAAYDGRVQIEGDVITLQPHIEYDNTGRPIHTLACSSFEDGLQQFRHFVDEHLRYPLTGEGEYESSLRRWYQEIAHEIIPVTYEQRRAFDALAETYKDLPKSRKQLTDLE